MVLNSIPAASADPASWVGQRVGEYMLKDVLRETVWTRTFLASTANGRKTVEIVFFHKQWARYAGPQDRAPVLLTVFRAFSETRGTQLCLKHDRVKEGKLAGLDYLVMAPVTGESLGQVLSRSSGALSLPHAALVVHQVATVLRGGHAFRTGDRPTPAFHGSLHISDVVLTRDLPHPQVVVSGWERLWFLPEAIDQEFRDRRDQAVSREDADWLASVAPELVRRKDTERRVDERTDVYGLGVLFWMLLTGRHPFSQPEPGEHLRAYWQRVHVQEVPSAEKQLPGIHPRIRDLIDSCLQFKPEDRTKSPQTVIDALEFLIPEVADRQRLSTTQLRHADDMDMAKTILRPTSTSPAPRSPSPLPFPLPPLAEAGPPARPEPLPSPVPPLPALPPVAEKPEPLSASAPLLAPGPGVTFVGSWKMGDERPPVAKKPTPSRRGWGGMILGVGLLLCIGIGAVFAWPHLVWQDAGETGRRQRRVTAPRLSQPVEVVVADADMEPVFTEVVRPPEPVMPPVAHPPILVVDPRDSRACTLAVINAGLGRRVMVAQKDACRRYCPASPTSDEVRQRAERYGLCPRAGPSPVQP